MKLIIILCWDSSVDVIVTVFLFLSTFCTQTENMVQVLMSNPQIKERQSVVINTLFYKVTTQANSPCGRTCVLISTQTMLQADSFCEIFDPKLCPGAAACSWSIFECIILRTRSMNLNAQCSSSRSISNILLEQCLFKTCSWSMLDLDINPDYLCSWSRCSWSIFTRKNLIEANWRLPTHPSVLKELCPSSTPSVHPDELQQKEYNLQAIYFCYNFWQKITLNILFLNTKLFSCALTGMARQNKAKYLGKRVVAKILGKGGLYKIIKWKVQVGSYKISIMCVQILSLQTCINEYFRKAR